MPTDEPSFDGTLSDIVQPGELVADKYRIERIIGVGGMGVVVQAFHLHFEERVAIKLLHPQLVQSDEARARFEREARAAFKIKSEHVARVIDVGALSKARVPYMVMEYLEGTDMADVLAVRTRLAVEDSIDFIMQAAEAVGEAHTLGIVHRDLKPENLFITQRSDGTTCLKVLDFGLSKLHSEAAPRKRERTLTSTTQPMGTPQYMSPEQWMSARDVGPATDIWALGVMLYEFVTGVQPFNKDQLPQLCTMVLQGEPAPMRTYVPDVPQSLLTVVQRCLRKHPSDRYANIAQMAVDLHHAAPRRVRVSARRIAGVFRRAGIETSEGPPSSRRPPVAATVPIPRPKNLPEDTVPTPIEEEVSALRASRGEAYDSDTHVMVDRDAPVQERDATTLVMPEATPLPFMQPASTSASASGPHPAVPMGKAGSSGRYPAVQPDQSGASGEYLAPFQGAPGEGPTFDGLAATDRHRRAVTAQSWQHVLGEPPGASTSKRIAVIVASAVVVCVVVAAVAIVGGGSESAPQVTAPVSPPQTPLGEGADSESDAVDHAMPPAKPKVPAASVSGKKAGSSKNGSAKRPRPVPNRLPPVVKSPAAPKPEPSSIFDER